MKKLFNKSFKNDIYINSVLILNNIWYVLFNNDNNLYLLEINIIDNTTKYIKLFSDDKCKYNIENSIFINNNIYIIGDNILIYNLNGELIREINIKAQNLINVKNEPYFLVKNNDEYKFINENDNILLTFKSDTKSKFDDILYIDLYESQIYYSNDNIIFYKYDNSVEYFNIKTKKLTNFGYYYMIINNDKFIYYKNNNKYVHDFYNNDDYILSCDILNELNSEHRRTIFELNNIYYLIHNVKNNELIIYKK